MSASASDKKINFFIVGTQKGGTTFLWEYLKENSAAQMSAEKEIHFFDNEEMDWQNPKYSILHSYFSWEDRKTIRGEATPIYCYWPESLDRIRKYNQEAKIIMILRHPAKRAYSHWKMERLRGRETMSFDEAISKENRKRVLSGQGLGRRIYSYIERGFYSEQIERITTLFPKEQVLFLRTDELWASYDKSLTQVLNFINVARNVAKVPTYVSPKIEVNGGKATELPELSQPLFTQLTELYAGDIKACQKSCGINLEDWLELGYQEPMVNSGQSFNEKEI